MNIQLVCPEGSPEQLFNDHHALGISNLAKTKVGNDLTAEREIAGKPYSVDYRRLHPGSDYETVLSHVQCSVGPYKIQAVIFRGMSPDSSAAINMRKACAAERLEVVLFADAGPHVLERYSIIGADPDFVPEVSALTALSSVSTTMLRNGEQIPIEPDTWLNYLWQGAGSDSEYRKQVNDEMSLRFDLKVDPKLVVVSDAADLGVPPLAQEALKRMAEAWGADVSWKSTDYGESSVTFSHLLKSVIANDQPRLLGISNSTTLNRMMMDWTFCPDSFHHFLHFHLESWFDIKAVDDHFKKVERLR
jgi:hypothetical protein